LLEPVPTGDPSLTPHSVAREHALQQVGLLEPVPTGDPFLTPHSVAREHALQQVGLLEPVPTGDRDDVNNIRFAGRQARRHSCGHSYEPVSAGLS